MTLFLKLIYYDLWKVIQNGLKILTNIENVVTISNLNMMG